MTVTLVKVVLRDHATTTTLVFVFVRCFECKCGFCKVESLHVAVNVAIFAISLHFPNLKTNVISHYFLVLASAPPPKKGAKMQRLRIFSLYKNKPQAGSYPAQRFVIFVSSHQCKGAGVKLHSYPGVELCTFVLSTLLTSGSCLTSSLLDFG
jgi:hypothetical protein